MAIAQLEKEKKDAISPLEKLIKTSPKVAQAYELARLAHEGQVRLSKEPYLSHPVAVANILIEWLNSENTDEELIIAALLHDTTEDSTKVTYQTIVELFGDKVANMVEGVSKFRGGTDEQTRQKLAEYGYNDPRVFLIKLADRLHNMRTIGPMPYEKQIEKAKETLETYAPLAREMGLWLIKQELEDLSFAILDPVRYRAIEHQLRFDPRLDPEFIKNTTDLITRVIPFCTVQVRKNSFCAIERKRSTTHDGHAALNHFSQVNDVISFRVLVDDNENPEEELDNISRALGRVQSLNQYLGSMADHRFDNFIAEPRENGYSALQTTFETNYGALEIAITTKAREEFNNWGLISLLRRGQSIANFKRIIVFDDQGTPSFLPPGATVADFIFDRGVGFFAKNVHINEKTADFSTLLQNGAVLTYTIDTKSSPPPHIPQCIRRRTRTAIESAFLRDEYKRVAKEGFSLMEPVVALYTGYFSVGSMNDHEINSILSHFNVTSRHELYYTIGNNPSLLSKLKKYFEDNQNQIGKEHTGVSSIRIHIPKDRPGVLKKVSSIIAKNGGNIKRYQQEITDGGGLTLVFVVTGLRPKDCIKIKKILQRDKKRWIIQIV